MPERRVPRAFSLPWGSGLILEEAACEGGLHAPALQLLHYEKGEKKLHENSFTIERLKRVPRTIIQPGDFIQLSLHCAP